MNSDSETSFLRNYLKPTCRAVAAKAEDLKLKTALHLAGSFQNLPALLGGQRLNLIENLRNAHHIEVTRICAPLQCVIRTALFKILRCPRLRFRDRVGEIEAWM